MSTRSVKTSLLILLIFITQSVLAADISRGKDLHDSNCTSCHKEMMGGDGTEIYTRDVKRIETYPALIRQVKRCRDSLGVPWPDEHVMDVVYYLNKNFYHYKQNNDE